MGFIKSLFAAVDARLVAKALRIAGAVFSAIASIVLAVIG